MRTLFEKNFEYRGRPYVHKFEEFEEGKIEYSFSDMYFYIENIWIKPEHRGKGYGKRELEGLLDIAKNLNLSVYLLVEPIHEDGIDHNRLVEWYKHNGFIEEKDRGELPYNYNMVRYRTAY